MASPFEKSILITGGAGYLGRGILRFLETYGYRANVTVYSRDEQKQYALRSRYPRVRTVLGDVCDTERLTAVMAGHELVIHAAALKHIPEAERDVSVAFRTNVIGSLSVAQAAMRAGVHQVIGISTDKVCAPQNTYGATKMLMERTFQEAQRMAPHMRFNNVRYGNVVSSTGSVVPLFIDQYKSQGQVSITSPQMTRFWFGVEDAVMLIEYAIRSAKRGHTYVAQCPAMGIVDVAEAVWRFTGHEDSPPDFKLIGVRPGEKLHEVLVDGSESPYAFYEDGYIVIPPALSHQGGNDRTVNPYSSDLPHRWLSVDEMVGLIRDAERV